MAYKLLTAYNLTDDPTVLFVYVNDITNGVFMDFLLVAIWCVFTIGLYMVQKKSVGSGDAPVSMTVGSFMTTIFAIIFRLITVPIGSLPLVSGYALAILIVTTILSFAWLLNSRD